MSERKLCRFCKYRQTVTAQDGWCFGGCFHPPYKGKFIAEIDCPMTDEEKAGIEREIKLPDLPL